MKVQELLMNIKNKEFKLERGLEVKKYLPIDAKKTIAQAIIYDCTTEDNGMIKADSVRRYMSYIRYMITSHTNLQYTDDDYDSLCSTEYGETNLLNAIINCFADDAKECTRILNLMLDDLVYENSIECTIGKLLFNLNGVLGKLSSSLQGKIEGFDLKNMLPEDVTAEQVTNILNLLGK